MYIYIYIFIHLYVHMLHRCIVEVSLLGRRPFWETSTITWSTKHGLRHLPGRQHRPPSGAFGKTSTTLRFLQYLVKYANQKYIFSILRTQLGKDLTLETNLKIRSECTWDYRQSKVPERCPTRAQHRYLEACVVAAASKISMCFMGGSLQTGPCRKH